MFNFHGHLYVSKQESNFEEKVSLFVFFWHPWKANVCLLSSTWPNNLNSVIVQMESVIKEESSLNFLSKNLRLAGSKTNNFGVCPFKILNSQYFYFSGKLTHYCKQKVSLLIIIRGVKFLKVFQIDVRFMKHALFLRSPAPHKEVMLGSC